MAATAANQRIEAFQNWNTWESKQALSSSCISIFGVRGRKFVLIKKTDSLLVRIWASFLKAVRIINIDRQATESLYKRTMALLHDPEMVKLIKAIPSSKDGTASPPLFGDPRQMAQEIAVLSAEKARLDAQIQNLHDEHASQENLLNELIRRLQSDIETLKQSKIQSEQALQVRIAQQQTEVEKLQQAEKEAEEIFKRQMHYLEREKNDLENLYQGSELQHNAQVAILLHKKAELDEQIRNLQADLEARNAAYNQLSSVNNVLSVQTAELQMQKQQLETNLKDLQAKLDDLNLTSQKEKDAVIQQLADLTAARREWEADRQKLLDKIVDGNAQHEVLAKKWEGEKQALEKQVNDLNETMQHKMDELKNELEKVRDKDTQVDHLIEENEELHVKLLELNALKERIQSQTKIINSNQELLGELSLTFENIERERDQLKAENKTLSKEKSELGVKMEQLRQELFSLKEQSEASQAPAPSTSTATNEKIEEAMAELKKQLEYWQSQHTNTSHELTQLKNVHSDQFKLFLLRVVESQDGIKALTSKRHDRDETTLEKLLREYNKRYPNDFISMVNAIRYSHLQKKF